MADDLEIVKKNIEKISDIVEEDPEFFKDVKDGWDSKFQNSDSDKETAIFSPTEKNMDIFSGSPELLAKLKTDGKIKYLISPDIIVRSSDNDGEKLFHSNLANYLKGLTYSFGVRYIRGANFLTQYIAIPTHGVPDLLMNQILKESKDSILKSLTKHHAKTFRGAEPKCVALSVYSKKSSYVIWEIAWDLNLGESSAYSQDFRQLFLHREIPIIGASEGEAFLLMATEEEIPQSIDDEINLKRVAEKLSLIEKQIENRGYKIEHMIDDIRHVPYSCKELASMGIFIQKNGQLKSVDQIIRELSEITSEQIIGDKKLRNRRQLVDSLLDSFVYRYKNPESTIYKELQSVSGVPYLADKYSITRQEIVDKKILRD